MKRTLIFLLLATMLLGFAGCRLNYMEPEEMEQFLNDIVENIGNSQITDDEDLFGTRYLSYTEDSYAGKYYADCSQMTGRDVVFGGRSVNSKEFFLSGHIQPISGTATVRIRLNDEVTELEPDSDGNFKAALNLSSGGNYIMVVYEKFSGKVEMDCQYASQNVNISY